MYSKMKAVNRIRDICVHCFLCTRAFLLDLERYLLWQSTVKMSLKLLKQTFFFFGHEDGQFLSAEGQLELYATDISVDHMRFDKQCPVEKPCAACGIPQVIDWKDSRLHFSDAKLEIVGCLFISKGQCTDIFT